MTKHVKMAIPTSHCAGSFLPWILKHCLHLIDEFVSRGYRRHGLKKDDLSPRCPTCLLIQIAAAGTQARHRQPGRLCGAGQRLARQRLKEPGRKMPKDRDHVRV